MNRLDMTTISTEPVSYSLTERATDLWSNLHSWVGKGLLALLDQGLISGSNFLIAITLARQLVPAEYGAYALAYQVFLMLSVVYSSLILEPMSVFGSSVYQDCQREYLRVLLRIHLCIAAAVLLVLGSSTWVAHELAKSSGLPGALAGLAFAAPCVLLFWLARRAFYLKLRPQAPASGTVFYAAILLGGLLTFYWLRLLTPFRAFLLMALGALVTGPVLLLRLKRALEPAPTHLSLLEVAHRHWGYGRWALAGSLAIWFSGAIYYPFLGTFHGLAETGSWKALQNFSSPIGQAFSAFSLLSLPYASRVHHQAGQARSERLAWRLTFLYAGGTMAYWAIIILFRKPIVHFLYAGKYMQVASLLPWIALASVLRIGATAQAISLRAMKSPSRVFAAYCSACAGAVIVGIPATWAFGVPGAVFALILSSGTALIVAFLLVHRGSHRISGL